MDASGEIVVAGSIFGIFTNIALLYVISTKKFYTLNILTFNLFLSCIISCISNIIETLLSSNDNSTGLLFVSIRTCTVYVQIFFSTIISIRNLLSVNYSTKISNYQAVWISSITWIISIMISLISSLNSGIEMYQYWYFWDILSLEYMLLVSISILCNIIISGSYISIIKYIKDAKYLVTIINSPVRHVTPKKATTVPMTPIDNISVDSHNEGVGKGVEGTTFPLPEKTTEEKSKDPTKLKINTTLNSTYDNSSLIKSVIIRSSFFIFITLLLWIPMILNIIYNSSITQNLIIECHVLYLILIPIMYSNTKKGDGCKFQCNIVKLTKSIATSARSGPVHVVEED
ncbi:MAG: hypothetical protein Solumvirus2_40 [Solumvirus sp.]|uniref:Uncharacterized protein n=1 Tax=Solumvirus sp. TaxID=2487773 RepID=A0A3G5AJQ1_9VIRU|nr:MAG: hypothetical protein Solumvirus2_40 [Solumvirus sp.]